MQAIVALKAQYCERMDGKEWDRWASLFTDDAVMQFGPSAEAAVQGREAIKKLVSRQLKRGESLHEAWNPEVTELEPGRVRVVWEMRDRATTPLYALRGEGFYEDEYVETSGGWRIAKVRLHRRAVDLQPRSAAMGAILWLQERGWLGRIVPSAGRALGDALYVGLGPGERP
jgi:3-phenylpropionate/cinnamic acid dioxygenase small subunit